MSLFSATLFGSTLQSSGGFTPVAVHFYPYLSNQKVTSASGTGTTATLTFIGTLIIPVGQIIGVLGVNPAGYNTTYSVVTASSAGSVSYANTTTGAYVSGGTIYPATNTATLGTETVPLTASIVIIEVQGGASYGSPAYTSNGLVYGGCGAGGGGYGRLTISVNPGDTMNYSIGGNVLTYQGDYQTAGGGDSYVLTTSPIFGGTTIFQLQGGGAGNGLFTVPGGGGQAALPVGAISSVPISVADYVLINGQNGTTGGYQFAGVGANGAGPLGNTYGFGTSGLYPTQDPGPINPGGIGYVAFTYGT